MHRRWRRDRPADRACTWPGHRIVSQAAGFFDDLRGLREEHGALSAIGRSRALYQRWASHFGVDVLDGIGMTEMLRIFLSSRPGAVRPGATGVAVPG
jgi:acyl-coenzyme A synthetase/AMP-(fatty) acid ligase